MKPEQSFGKLRTVSEAELLRDELKRELKAKNNRLFQKLLKFWDDMVKLTDDEFLRKKLRFLDDERFPEVYFAYTLLLSGETDPAVFGNETNPQKLLHEFLEEFPTKRAALYETVKVMIKEKYRRQHVYEI